MIQTTLDGSLIGYTCHKCGKVFECMGEVVRHSKRAHKKPKRETINFVLWNYKMISTKTVEVKI